MSTDALVAVVLAAFSGALLAPGDRHPLGRLRAGAVRASRDGRGSRGRAGGAGAATGTGSPGWDLRRLPVLPPALAGVAAVSVLAPAALPAAALVAFGVVASRRSSRRAHAQRRTREEITAWLPGLVAELRSGRAPGDAFTGLPPDHPLAAAGRAIAVGADVGSAVREAGQAPGAQALVEVAAAIDLCERTGAPLSHVVERVVAGLRAREALRREVRAQVAPVRSTAVLLAVLPLLTTVMGAGLGGDPVGWLLGTAPGAACLTAGAALALAGGAWTHRLATSAERS